MSRNGFDWDELDEIIKLGVEKVLSLSLSSVTQVTLVQHDWGSFAGFHFNRSFPEKVASIVALDVLTGFGKAAEEDASPFVSEVLRRFPENEYSFGGRTATFLCHMHYQLLLALAHIAGSRLGGWAGNAVLGFVLRYCFTWPTAYIFSPTLVGEFSSRPWEELQWTLTYPYATSLGAAFSGNYEFIEKARAPVPTSAKKVLFLYGQDKRTFFHSPAQLAVLEHSEHGEYAGIAGGHWFYDLSTRTTTSAAVDEVVARILAFLDDKRL